jgi:PAS domain S-box-containing protein
VRGVARIRASVHAKLLGAFLLVALLLVTMGAVGLRTIAGVSRQSRLLDQAHERVDTARQVEQALGLQMASTRNALLLRDDTAIESILRERGGVDDMLARLESGAPSTERERIQRIRALRDEMLAAATQVARRIREGKHDEAMALHLGEGAPRQREIATLVTRLVQAEEAGMGRLRQDVAAASRRAQLAVGGFAVASILLALALGFVISWSLILPVRQAEGFLGQVARGDFRATIAVPNRDELGALAGQMNRMSRELHRLSEDQRRLVGELQARNRELTESLDQRTATGEILHVINSSPTDVQPVFDTIVRSAVRLCGGVFSALFRFDGELIHQVAQHNFTPEALEEVRRLYPAPPSRAHGSARAILERAVVHIPDVELDAEYRHRELSRAVGLRSGLFVPMLRDGNPVGVIMVARAEPGPFPESQVALLRTFAEQAVIAIENVRLFTALEARNRDLTHALEQQTATGEILRVISSSPTDAQPVFDSIARSAVRLCDAAFAYVFRLDGALMHVVAHHNLPAAALAALDRQWPMAPDPRSVPARAILERRVVHVADVLAEPDHPYLATSRALGIRTMLTVPMLREGEPIGAIAVYRQEVQPFSEQQVALVAMFASQAVIAVENVRLFRELEARNRDLTETLEQQIATSEILRVISSSPTDVQPVFDTLARSAARLCEAELCFVFRFDGERLHLAAHHGLRPEAIEALERAWPRLPSPGSAAGRSVLHRAVAHIPDVQADPDYQLGEVAEIAGFRSTVGVPILRDGIPIGTITLSRLRPGALTDRQLALLQTFADQAMIAIENVRLFTEVQARNRALSEALERQTATGEVLKVISRSAFDLAPVLQVLAENATKLCLADSALVYQFDGAALRVTADHGIAAEFRSWLSSGGQGAELHPGPGTVTGRAARERRTVHVPDVLAEPGYAVPEAQRRGGFRAALGVPMLRDDSLVGVFFLSRQEPRPFTDDQIELVTTFADQAVIAIENVRLFRELEARNRDLTETLEQQTATSEILRVISSSPTDVQPVFDTIAATAVRLCGAKWSGVTRFDGEQIQLASLHGVSEAGAEALRRAFPRPPSRVGATDRAVLTGAVAYVPDVQEDPEYRLHELAQAAGYRSQLAVPMIREGQPIGTITVAGASPAAFSERQIALLRTFADQAVIAIENVRLFRELEARNRDLTETLEQQTATSEVLKVISRSAFDLQPVLQTLVENATRLCGAEAGVIYRFDGELQRLAAAHNISPELRAFVEQHPLAPGGGTAAGRAMLEGRPVHIHDVLADPGYTYGGTRVGGYRTILGIPMLREGVAIGVLSVWRKVVQPFTARQIELVTTFADQGAIAIENVRLFQELEARNRDLTETLEQQRATSEVLRVISASPTDVQPVFDAIARNAALLCEAQFCFVYRFDGRLLHFVAHHGVTREGAETVRRAFPAPPSRGSAAARAVLDCAVAQIPDVHADPDFTLGTTARIAGYRSAVGVPMVRDGVPIGSIAIARSETGLVPVRQVELLKTFADQAVIAIENVRLFQQLEARTRELTRSIDELRALGEVSQAVGSTLDLETVLETIVSRAVQLSSGHGGIIYEFDEETQSFRVRAADGITPEHLAAVRGAPIRLGEGAVGRAGVVREPVEVTDLEAEQPLVAAQARQILIRQGMRSLLALPLVREDRLLGGLVIIRRERGAFPPAVVATLRTFAAQSVLAIHNARLFREIQRQKQYSETLVETSPVAIVTLDVDGKVVGWNPGAERLFGYTPAEALGRGMADLVAVPEAQGEVHDHIRRTLGGERVRTIARRTRKDGTPVDVEISAVPVVVGGARVGLIGTYHDITELLQARRQAEAANEAKGAFLATMSHEIRTPMNAVIGMSGLLLSTPLTEEQREYAEIVRQSGEALLTVINDILDFSKIEAGRLELEAQPFDLRECVEGALDLVAPRAAEKGLDLAYLIAEDTPGAIVGDVTRLRQILLNLLSNAVKFTERGEVVLSVAAHRLDGPAALHELAFAVRDTGIGIPADRLGRLFRSFSQVDASTTRRYGGTGLGLAISQRLTELMGGRIDVTSEVGRGSEFRFTIRAMAAEAPASSRRDLGGTQPSLHGKRVLVVDDNATNRRILATHLGAWGMEVEATGSPAEALAWIRGGRRFDLGILDMHMPEMDGVGLARAMREQPAGAALPLVLFTSLGRREARAEAEGFAAYLHKPIKPSQLFDALVSVLADRPVPVRGRATAATDLDPDLGRRHPLRILLAEDNAVNQKLALRLLDQMGYRADVAANGLEAIAAVERQAYDVVLMDVQMPELDGLEASREINRRWGRGDRPRIVAMTANAMQGDRERCEAAGMDDYVSKPIRIEELVAALVRCRPRAGTGEPGRRVVAPAAGRLPAAGSGAAGPVDAAIFDRLVATMGGGFVAELVDTFIEDGQALVAALRRALAAGEVDAFRRAVHSLKANSETLGAAGLGALARELEGLARAGALDRTGDRLERLAAAYEAAARALGERRRDLAG